MPSQLNEMLALIAIGVLFAIFISAFLILIIVCRKQKLYYKKRLCNNEDMRPEVMLISSDRELNLGEVRINTNFEQILADEQWIDDATGLVPHCLSILKTCRFLTESLTALTIADMRTKSGLAQIIETARQISWRVDDTVRSMYPPLDPRLLEARAAALSLAVTHLVLITRYECGQKGKSVAWINRSLAEMDSHLVVLHEAALAQEAATKIQNAMVVTS